MKIIFGLSDRNFLGFFLVINFNSSFEQQCPARPTASAHEQEFGLALTGSEYRSFTTVSYAACLMACEADISCMSLNFLMTTSRCDLNTQTKDSTPAYFIERHNSIYSINPAGRTRARRGTQTNPAKSCLEILKSGTSTGTGVYWIDPPNTGNPIQAYCDMTTDGGGWTVVKRLILQSAKIPKNEEYSTYEIISKYNVTSKNVFPKGIAMLDIHQKMGFHQIHFYCHKKSVGRVVSIMTRNDTAGQQVVRFFTDDAFAKTTFPAACGSFDRLPEDRSYLGQNCAKWGRDISGNDMVNMWSYKDYNTERRINVRPFSIKLDKGKTYIFGIAGGRSLRCDDRGDEAVAKKGDILQISVR